MKSDSSDSATSDSPPMNCKKKRKPTYLVRKEELQALQEKLQTLRDELADLKGLSEESKRQLQQTKAENQVLNNAVTDQQLAMASVVAMFTERLQTSRDNPIYTPIHLPKQSEARRQALMAMKDDKLQRAFRYTAARTHHFDLWKPRSSMDCYEESDGSFTCNCLDVTQFRDVHSLKQVADALVYYLLNMDTNIAEKTGDVVVREDYDNLTDGAHILNHRITSNHESGETTEANICVFFQYFGGPNAFGDHPCAILAADSVDADDLHPYNSQHRIRRDVTAAVLLTLEREKQQQDSSNSSHNNEELVVVSRRVTFIKIHRPQFEVPSEVLNDLHDGIAKWPAVMLQGMRDSLLGRSSSSGP